MKLGFESRQYGVITSIILLLDGVCEVFCLFLLLLNLNLKLIVHLNSIGAFPLGQEFIFSSSEKHCFLFRHLMINCTAFFLLQLSLVKIIFLEALDHTL